MDLQAVDSAFVLSITALPRNYAISKPAAQARLELGNASVLRAASYPQPCPQPPTDASREERSARRPIRPCGCAARTASSFAKDSAIFLRAGARLRQRGADAALPPKAPRAGSPPPQP